jgi:hypothetical protein
LTDLRPITGGIKPVSNFDPAAVNSLLTGDVVVDAQSELAGVVGKWRKGPKFSVWRIGKEDVRRKEFGSI